MNFLNLNVVFQLNKHNMKKDLNCGKTVAAYGAVAVQSTSPLFARKSFWCVAETIRKSLVTGWLPPTGRTSPHRWKKHCVPLKT